MHILMYHEVTNGVSRNVHTVTAEQLRRQLQWLIDNGYRPARLLDYGKAGDKAVALTFDDAYVDFIEVALPILQSFGFSATVFVISDLIGKQRRWADGEDDSQPPLMDWEQIAACQQAGIDIGSHTATHPNLIYRSTPELARELFKSRMVLSNQLGGDIDLLCYPYGKHNREVRRLAYQAGYRLACASRPFYVGKTRSPALALDRIAMLATDTHEDFIDKINAPFARQLQWYRWRLRHSWRDE